MRLPDCKAYNQPKLMPLATSTLRFASGRTFTSRGIGLGSDPRVKDILSSNSSPASCGSGFKGPVQSSNLLCQ